MTPRAEVERAIDAPIARVWSALVDVRAYREWNPFIVDVDAPARPLTVGDDITLHVRWADGGGVRSPEHVVRLEPPEEVDGVWRATLAYRFSGWIPRLGLVRATRVQTLTQTPPGPTVYHSEERFHGLAARWVPLGRVRDGFERQADAMKRRAEGEPRAM